MKLHELFEPIDEISSISLSKSKSWMEFDNSPYWYSFELLPRRFMGFMVLYDWTQSNSKGFVIIDPNALGPKRIAPMHEIDKIDRDIPKKAIVGGIDLNKSRGGPAGVAWYVEYLAFNPRYQGRGLATKFYRWLLENYEATGVGAIKAGSYQTPGSRKLWADLSKNLLVFGYDPKSKKVTQLEIGDDGLLDGTFDIYPSDREEIRKAYNQDLKMLDKELRSKQITHNDYNRQYSKIMSKLDQELSASERAGSAEMYAVLPKLKKSIKR